MAKKAPMSGAEFIGWLLLGVAVLTALAFCCGYSTG